MAGPATRVVEVKARWRLDMIIGRDNRKADAADRGEAALATVQRRAVFILIIIVVGMAERSIL